MLENAVPYQMPDKLPRLLDKMSFSIKLYLDCVTMSYLVCMPMNGPEFTDDFYVLLYVVSVETHQYHT